MIGDLHQVGNNLTVYYDWVKVLVTVSSILDQSNIKEIRNQNN